MNVYTWEQFVDDKVLFGVPVSLTVGVFDGVHRGHQKLIGRILEDDQTESAVLTFSGHPARVLNSDAHAGEVQTTRQKLETLEDMGVANVILIDFSGNFSKLSGKAFLDSVRKAVCLKRMIVGSDFRCGHRGQYDTERIRSYGLEYGFFVEVLPPVFDGETPVSSTRIRKAARAAQFDSVAILAGRPYVLDLRQIPLGRKDEVWTGEVSDFFQILPPDGPYGVKVRTASGCVSGALIIERPEFRLEMRNEIPVSVEFIPGKSV